MAKRPQNALLQRAPDVNLSIVVVVLDGHRMRPSVPIRKMVGMMLLKSIYNLSDEGVVLRWMENPYMQYFTGEKFFRKRPPMNPIDMTKFRKRIGEKGAEKIFRLSLLVNAEEITQKEMKSVMSAGPLCE